MSVQTLKHIPHARRVAVGSAKGQVPSEAFAHLWFDYFNAGVWTGVIETFLDDRDGSGGMKAKL